MARESRASRSERLHAIARILRTTYPDAHCELVFHNPLQLLVATILSAQCTDKQVNLVTARLFENYHTAADYARAPLERLEADIRRIGLFRNKARHIQAACRELVRRHQGEVPRTMEELTALDGVGRKTANVVLGNAFQIEAGVVVDTHVARLARRLGLTTESNPTRIERALMDMVPRKDWTLFSHWLIWHGRRRCFARNPDCAACELAVHCPSRNPARPRPSRRP